MAYVFSDKDGKIVKAQKKGTSAKGDKQYWMNSETKSRFTTEINAELKVDQETGKLISSSKSNVKKETIKQESKVITKPKVTKQSNKIKTIIKVNSNNIKEVPGEISIDDAFALASNYFREITKTDVSTSKDVDGNITISFSVRTGTKG